RRRHTRFSRDWSSDVCSSDLLLTLLFLRQLNLAKQNHLFLTMKLQSLLRSILILSKTILLLLLLKQRNNNKGSFYAPFFILSPTIITSTLRTHIYSCHNPVGTSYSKANRFLTASL